MEQPEPPKKAPKRQEGIDKMSMWFAAMTTPGGDAKTGSDAVQVNYWRSAIFAPLGDGQRRRRGSDVVRLVVALLAVLCSVLVVRANAHAEQVVEKVLSPPPQGIKWLVDVFWIGGSFGTVAILLLLALVSRRWSILRDLAVAAVGTLAVTGVLILLVGSSAGRPDVQSLAGYSLSFPVLNVAVAVAVAITCLPYLARGIQRLIEFLLAFAIVATLVAGHGLPVNVIGSMAVGWGVAAAVHLAFGSPLGLPSGEEMAALLKTIGIQPSAVTPARLQTWGAAHYIALTDDDKPLAVTFYGRDAVDAQLVTKIWRYLFYRDSGPMLSLTRLQQVEHESSVTQLAERHGACVPEVLVASSVGPSHDAVLISRLPAGDRLTDLPPEQITDAHLDELFGQFMKLRAANISHGAVSPETIVIDVERGGAALVDFCFGTSSATPFALDTDMAGSMASAALSVGPERTAASVARVIPPELLSGVLGHLQGAGLAPSVAQALRGKKKPLSHLRALTAADARIDVPELIKPYRVSWSQVLVAAGSLIGGWALILTLINASHSIGIIRHAEWGWVVATFLLCAVSYVGAAISDRGSVTGTLPFGRVLGLEVSNTFVSLAGGGTAVLATDIRFFQVQGYPPSVAVTSSALDGASDWIVKLLLFAIAVPIAWHDFHFQNSLHAGSYTKVLWLILGVVVVIAIVLTVVLSVPKWRHKISQAARKAWTDLKTNFTQLASQPQKGVQLFGGELLAQLVIILALGTALQAFGAHLSIAALIIAITVAGILADVAPVPGGMGVAEAGLIAALVAAGISKGDATAAVFVQRLFSAYLPPIVGWFSLMSMRKKEYL